MNKEIVRGIVRQLEGSMQIPLVKATLKVVGNNDSGFRVSQPEEKAATANILFRGKVEKEQEGARVVVSPKTN